MKEIVDVSLRLATSVVYYTSLCWTSNNAPHNILYTESFLH